MTGSEFAFLGMGLLGGLIAATTLVASRRGRAPSTREVRITVAPDAIPRRRAATLSDAGVVDMAVPARGGPGDRSVAETPVAATRPATRTPVLADVRPGGASQTIAVSGGIDPMLAALRASALAAESDEAAVDAADRRVAVTAAAGRTNPSGSERPASTRPATGRARRDRAASSDPCADARRLADERCRLAEGARAQADAAEAAHRAAQRAYDQHEAASARASEGSDARAVRRAKDEAQDRFRAARANARTTAEAEDAARRWLDEINEINTTAREALGALIRERAAEQRAIQELERTGLEADVARIAAETAEAACVAAREVAADCDERAAGEAAATFPLVPSGAPIEADDRPRNGTGGALAGAGSPRIFRLLRGDRAALHHVASALAGDDAEARKRWQSSLSDLVDAIVADSIAAASLEFPDGHLFWGRFTPAQARDIAAALASLGYRFDGQGGWVDERVPPQRDLSLAIGYAGLDPMRIRQWPSDAEVATLLEDVNVAAAEHLAGAAGDLALGELVAMLGRRADALTDLWNAWGRVRPLLLEDA